MVEGRDQGRRQREREEEEEDGWWGFVSCEYLYIYIFMCT